MNGPRVLVIARDFAPINSPGATRVGRFVRHLPACGWQPTVLTMQRLEGRVAAQADVGPSLLQARGFDTKSRLAFLGRYPSILAFPDLYASWIPDGVRIGLAAIRAQRFDALLSSSPPISAHAIAWALQRRTGLPWVADLRDPWNLSNPFGPILRAVDRRCERLVYARADRIVVTTPELADSLRSRTTADVRVITNGFDEETFGDASAQVSPSETFRMVHTGFVGPGYRDASELLQALRLGLDRGGLPPDARLELYGVEGEESARLTTLACELGLRANLRVSPRVTRAEAVATMGTAALLLVLQERSAFVQSVPSKVYEYLRSGRPILAIAPVGSATERLLRDIPGTLLAAQNCATQIAPLMAQAFSAWRADPHRNYQRAIDRYRGDNLTAELAAVLSDVLHRRNG